MQRFFCVHCGIEAESCLTAWIHQFTDHGHRDIALEPATAKAVLETMQPMERGREVDLRDWR